MTYELAMKCALLYMESANKATLNPNREADSAMAQAFIAYARELREAEQMKEYMEKD